MDPSRTARTIAAMTGLRLALVGDPNWAGTAHARRALQALAPDAQLHQLPTGSPPTVELDGLWLLTPPASGDPTAHDATISWALHLGIPFVGPLGGSQGGSPFVTAVPGSRLATMLGPTPRELHGAAADARTGLEYVTPVGTAWFAQAHRDDMPAVITAAGSPFATLLDHPLATDAGLHPLLVDFIDAARRRATSRHLPEPAAPAPTAGPSFAPFADDEPRSYLHQMRTARYRWWRPLLALAAGLATFFAISMFLSVVWLVLDPSLLETTDAAAIDPTDPVTMLIGNLMLAGLIPATLVATRVGHWRPMGKVWSVTGRIRWGWLLRAALVTTLVWGAYLALAWILSGEEPTARPEHWGWLLLITLLTTPLQAAGEEVAFRGGLMQGVGAWIGRPVLALVVSTVLSAATFALAHTSLDPWILLDLGGMAIACCYLTWRTGGLEAAIVLHVVNNLVITIGLTLLGGIQDAYVTEETTSTAGGAGLGVLATAVMTAILLWLARRSGVAPQGFGRPALNPESR